MAFAANGKAASFLEKVACHREMQSRLHELLRHVYNYSSFHEYIFNCVVEILEEKIKMRQGEEKLRKMHNKVNQ